LSPRLIKPRLSRRGQNGFLPACALHDVPLDQMNPEAKKVANRQLHQDAVVSARLPLDKEDQCPPDVFARILWRATKGPAAAFPAYAGKPAKDED
jgi:hypothetical protein